MRAHVDGQTLRGPDTFPTIRALHASVQAERPVFRLTVFGFVTPVKPLSPGSLEALPAVRTAEVSFAASDGHFVPALAVSLQVAQILEATGAGRAGVSSPGWDGRVGLMGVDCELLGGVEG